MARKAAGSRKARAARVQSKTPPAKKLVAKAASPHKLPSVFGLTKMTARLLVERRRVLAGIMAVYFVLYTLLVQALSGGIDARALRDDLGGQLTGGLAAYAQLIGSTPDGADGASGAYQLMVVVIVSLALIWALRTTINRPRIRDAFYKGMHPLIPFVLILLLICVQLLPLLVAANVYVTVVVYGIAATMIERIFWGAAALLIGLVSLYLIASSIIALYIVSLPDMTPLKALQAAKQLMRVRRWEVLRKMLFLPFVLLITSCFLIVPTIIVIPDIVPGLLIIVGAVSLTVAHAYMYSLYGELLRD